MTRSLKALLAALLIITPVLTSCSEVKDPVAAAPTVQTQDGLIGDLLGGVVHTVVNLLDGLLTGPDANGSTASAWIGPKGGTLKTAAYTLTVPAYAVTTNTRFDLAPTNTGTYSVDLHAYQQGLLRLVDVGGKGFRKPVTLTISYANAKGVTKPSNIDIIYLRPDGTLQIMQTSVDSNTETVSSALPHFSKYAMVQN